MRHYTQYGDNGTISKFWDIVVCPFFCMSVCVYKVDDIKISMVSRCQHIAFAISLPLTPSLGAEFYTAAAVVIRLAGTTLAVSTFSKRKK